MFSFQKVLKKEKKTKVKKNDFFMFDYAIDFFYKINIIKINLKFIYFKIILSLY